MTPSNASLLVIERKCIRHSKLIAYLLDTQTLRKNYIEDNPLETDTDVADPAQNMMTVAEALAVLHGIKWLSESELVGLSDVCLDKSQ